MNATMSTGRSSDCSDAPRMRASYILDFRRGAAQMKCLSVPFQFDDVAGVQPQRVSNRLRNHDSSGLVDDQFHNSNVCHF